MLLWECVKSVEDPLYDISYEKLCDNIPSIIY